MDTMSDYDADSYLRSIKVKSNAVGIIIGIIISLISAVIVISLSVAFIIIYRLNDIRAVKDGTANTILSMSSKLQNSLIEAFGSLEVFTEAMMKHDYNISDSYFRDLAFRWRARHQIIEQYGYMYGDGMQIQMIYPHDSLVIGLKMEYFPQNPMKAASGNSTIMFGPDMLGQGTIVLIGMNPIFYPNGSFFGVSGALINLDILFDIVGIKNNLTGYKYVFQTERNSLIFANNTPIIDDMITVGIETLKEKWLVHIIPNEGWLSRDLVWLEGIAVTVLTILSMLLTIFVVRQIVVSIYQRDIAKYLKDKLELEIRDRFRNLATERIVVEKYNDTSNEILDLMNIVILRIREGKVVDFSGDVNKYFGIDEPRNMPIENFLTNLASKKTKIIHKSGILTDCITDQKMQDDINIIMIKVVGNSLEEVSTGTGKTVSDKNTDNV